MSYGLNFSEKHSLEGIHSRQKTVTIRPKRKRVLGVGRIIPLTTGSRTPQYQKLISVKLTQESIVKIENESAVWVDGARLSSSEISTLALEDGEKDVSAFIDFFRHRYGLPFEGTLFRWEYLDRI